MRTLLQISDVRKVRQLSKQLNNDAFTGRVNEVQNYQLEYLLGNELFYDFSLYLEAGWLTSTETFTRDSTTQITASNVDLSSWLNYALKVDSETFVNVKSAVFGGVDTVLIVEGYDLPETITLIEYRADNDYTLLLNGTTYINTSGNTVLYNGLRGFLSWHFLVGFTTDGDNKQSDVGNISLTGDMFAHTSKASKSEIKASYLQNAQKEQNNIVNYLNANTDLFALWPTKAEQSTIKFNSFVF